MTRNESSPCEHGHVLAAPAFVGKFRIAANGEAIPDVGCQKRRLYDLEVGDEVQLVTQWGTSDAVVSRITIDNIGRLDMSRTVQFTDRKDGRAIEVRASFDA